MAETSTPEPKQSQPKRRDASRPHREGPSESTLRFLMQFARSCRAVPASHSSMAIVNIN